MDENKLFHTPDEVRKLLGRENLSDKDIETLQKQVHVWIGGLIDDYFENHENDATIKDK